MTCDNIALLKMHKNKGRESWELSMVLNPDPSQLSFINIKHHYQTKTMANIVFHMQITHSPQNQVPDLGVIQLHSQFR